MAIAAALIVMSSPIGVLAHVFPAFLSATAFMQ
jgi:hypothetical protein